MQGNSRILDGGLVAAGTVQAVMADFPNLIWQDMAAHPIQSMVGIATLFLILARTIRVTQKIFKHRREKIPQ